MCFETIKTNFASIGFIREKGRFHTQQCLHMTNGFVVVILQYLYIPIEAVTIKEYMDAIFITSGGSCIFVTYLSAVLKTELIFISIDEVERLVNERKFIVNIHTSMTFHNFYLKTNNRIKRTNIKRNVHEHQSISREYH